jgi:hypothetical protein
VLLLQHPESFLRELLAPTSVVAAVSVFVVSVDSSFLSELQAMPSRIVNARINWILFFFFINIFFDG